MLISKKYRNFILAMLLLIFSAPKVYQDAHRLLAHHHFGQLADFTDVSHFTKNAGCVIASFLFYIVEPAEQARETNLFAFPELSIQALRSVFPYELPVQSFLMRGPPNENNRFRESLYRCFQ